MKKLCVLGITGSIGKNVCDVVRQNPNDFEIVGCALASNIKDLKEILKIHHSIKYVAIKDKKLGEELKKEYSYLTIFSDEDYLIKVIDGDNYDLVVNSLVGFDGLVPTIHTLNKEIDCALANKESLVVGGDLINKILKEKKCRLFPIDSEHVALAKLIKNRENEVNRLIITASGGSFRNLSREELSNVTVEQALNHPSWKMGAKITIDSATMMNKGFEIIEAYHLFHFPLDKIDVLLHDESIIHSLVEMKDHSLLADLGIADMRIPISYALYEGNYHFLDVKTLSLDDLQVIHFRKMDYNRYPAVELCKKALTIGGSMPCVLNGANDVCNLAFRENKIKFIEIEKIIEKVMNEHKLVMNPTLEDLIEINLWARIKTEEIIKRRES